MILKIKLADSKGQRNCQGFETLELTPNAIIHRASFTAEESNSEDLLLWKEVERNLVVKVYKQHITSISYSLRVETEDDCWQIKVEHAATESLFVVVQTEAEAKELFDAIDKWMDHD